MEKQNHWDSVYRDRTPTQVSWFQEHSLLSLQFIQLTGVEKAGRIIDVGGGASTLVDDLLADGFTQVTILDISHSALEAAQHRLGRRASQVSWLKADITQVSLSSQLYDVWHDRAVFHFLTSPEDRRKYVEAVERAVKPGGHVIVATFAPDGPLRCSGLDVVRYSPAALHAEFGVDFELVDNTREIHRTPMGTVQQFIYCYCRKS